MKRIERWKYEGFKLIKGTIKEKKRSNKLRISLRSNIDNQKDFSLVKGEIYNISLSILQVIVKD